MRGRKPKPTHLKVLAGNPGKRPLNKNEPKPAPRAPYCPRWLSPLAKQQWRRFVPVLEKLGLATEIDQPALAALFEDYAKWRQCEEVLAREGLTYEYTNKAGETNIVLRPEYYAAQKYQQQMRALLAEFGMTPSSRSRISLPEQKEQDEFEAFLNGQTRPASR